MGQPPEPTLGRETVNHALERASQTLLEQSASQCCRAVVVHADGYFRCSTCGNIIIATTGAVYPGELDE